MNSISITIFPALHHQVRVPPKWHTFFPMRGKKSCDFKQKHHNYNACTQQHLIKCVTSSIKHPTEAEPSLFNAQQLISCRCYNTLLFAVYLLADTPLIALHPQSSTPPKWYTVSWMSRNKYYVFNPAHHRRNVFSLRQKAQCWKSLIKHTTEAVHLLSDVKQNTSSHRYSASPM
jgi:hypothetical protein